MVPQIGIQREALEYPCDLLSYNNVLACYIILQSMQAQAKMAHAMGSTAKVMAATNKQMKLEDIQKTMANFDRESTKMDMAGEMSKSQRPHCSNYVHVQV